MRGRSSAALVLVGVAWASTALADEEAEGSACAITTDCAMGLRCIDGACVSVARGRIVSPAVIVRHEVSPGERAWIGDGDSYVLAVIVGDTVATVVTGAFVAAALTTGQGWFGIAALFPTTLTAPIIHAANGRGGPAAVSFFAWASVPPTITFLAFLAAFASTGAGAGDVIVIASYGAGIGAAIGLTTLDAYFARSARAQRSPRESFSIMPVFTPSHGGFTAGVVGSF